MTSVILDLDGTLVDSVYHHVMAWDEAFRGLGYDRIQLWRIHAAIGLGADRLIANLLGETPGDAAELTERHEKAFLERAPGLQPTRGALALLAELSERGVEHVIATSSGQRSRAALMNALGDPDVATTDADEVERAKPSPELLDSALGMIRAEAGGTVVVGDSPWDVLAARRAGMRSISVRTGGFSDADLHMWGATAVVDSPEDLLGVL